jgi:Fur family ferric uptake transcriptional regulator
MAAKAKTGASTVAEHIRRRGARATSARVAVLRLLREAPAPLSHAEIEARLGDVAPDRVTLYRVLDWLVDSGLAHKNADAGRVFRFSAASVGEHGTHVHFRCELCGGVYCLDASPPIAPALPLGFTLTRMDFDLRGTCAHCSAKQ